MKINSCIFFPISFRGESHVVVLPYPSLREIDFLINLLVVSSIPLDDIDNRSKESDKGLFPKGSALQLGFCSNGSLSGLVQK